MKKLNTFLTIILTLMTAHIFAQSGNIRFTAKKSATQDNQVLIYANNFSGTPISGVIGSSNITLCITFSSALVGIPSITSPIAGQTFDTPNRSIFGSDSVYSWNGTGSTATINFPAGGTTEVHIATITFAGGGVTTTVKIADIPAGGVSGFDYCYIAPGGNEHSGYTTPFYSIIPSDPLLVNSGGPNDATIMTYSYLGISNVTLPVKFLDFSASKKDNNAVLSWLIENESTQTDRYEIERSLNGTDFTKVNTVTAKNNGKSSNSYNLTDLNLTSLHAAGIIYYRVKQIDKDGLFIYSTTKNLRLAAKPIAISIYPNPVKNDANISIDLEENTKAIITIIDGEGKQLKNIEMQLFKGLNVKKISMASMASGSYLLKIETPMETKTISVVKAN